METLDIKKLNDDLAAAKKALAPTVATIKKHVASSEVYDVILGKEAYHCRNEVSSKAQNVYIFSNEESHDGMTPDEITISIREDTGKEASLLSPESKFSGVVWFFGFCDKCHREEHERAMKLAKELARKGDLLIIFSKKFSEKRDGKDWISPD